MGWLPGASLCWIPLDARGNPLGLWPGRQMAPTLRELRAMRGGWELGEFREGLVVVAVSARGALLGCGVFLRSGRFVRRPR